MSKSPKKPASKSEEVEVEPDAWERFKKTMDKVIPPKRRKPKPDSDDEAE